MNAYNSSDRKKWKRMGKLCELRRRLKESGLRPNSLKSRRPCKIRRMQKIVEVKQSQRKGA